MTTQFSNEVFPVNIEQELKKSYLDYAMSVIVGRALPDVRDGLKPVHRRVLFAMKELGNDFNKPYKKSARVVGDVIGKYHPHGDTAVYDTIVRMAQPFSLGYMLVDGQGNFGSIDGDAPAAMRYTEVRMSKIAHSLLMDLDKETVNFSPNYDETEMIPDVLPTRIPNLLLNGSSGIAVGMATNIPPHNLNEVIEGIIALIKNPKLSIEELMQHIPAPDFPTGAYISGHSGIVDAYKTGKGRIIVRAKAAVGINKKNGREQIVVTEIPYQVNKARLIEKIASLVKNKKIDGISELRDESDKDGMRIVMEIRKGKVSEIILNNLYAQTQMQISFGVNMVALVNNQPKLLTLKEILEKFIQHRKEIVIRRTIFELKKAKKRAHILEGLAIAFSNIDTMIPLIKLSKTPTEAKHSLLENSWLGSLVTKMLSGVSEGLCHIDDLPTHCGLHDSKYSLSHMQADAILELRLHRLTSLEQNKILEEFKFLSTRIEELIEILNDSNRLLEVICKELSAIKEQFSSARRSKIITSNLDLNYEDLITEESMMVTLSYDGYVKSQPLGEYNAQKRGGRGKSSTQIKAEDFVYKLQIASTHDTMLCFSSAGKVYWTKVYELPQVGRMAKGKPINNFLPIDQDERITAMMAVPKFSDDYYVFMATKKGTVKRLALSVFSRPRKGGIYALTLDKGDELLHVHLTNGNQEVMMFSDAGKVIRFDEIQVRPMGRVARGVRGMRIDDNHSIVDVIVIKSAQSVVLTATKNGYGKRTAVSNYRKTSRGSQGVISIATSVRNGLVVAAGLVKNNDDVMLMTDQGVLIRTHANEIRKTGRSAQGVKLINIKKNEKLVSVQVISDENSQE